MKDNTHDIKAALPWLAEDQSIQIIKIEKLLIENNA